MTTQPARRSEGEISGIMSRVRSRDTGPEVILRKALWSRGLRYRLYSSDLPGKPDIVISSQRLAIFVDGDYWHGGQWSRRHLVSLEEQFSKTGSKKYWLNKIRKNMSRDCYTTATLLTNGWKVLRFWESDIKKNLEECIDIILKVVTNGVHPTPLAQLPHKTFAEFFAGIGLVRLALERQGWTVAYANDLDVKKKEMYENHFHGKIADFHLDDIHKISVDRIPTVSLATASFPCNDLSLAGARAGLKGRHSSAFWGFIRIIEDMNERKPPMILLENVTGFLTSKHGNDLEEALLTLNRLGYSVDAFIMDALWFVPQSRQRLFIIATLDIGKELPNSLQQLDVQETETRPKKLKEFIVNHTVINWKLRDLPRPPTSAIKLSDILDNLPENAPEWWSQERAEYLLNQMNPRHRKVAESMISGLDWSYGTVFRRIRNSKSMAELRTDGVAGCLRTPRGGSGRQILFKAGLGRYLVRLLTPAECGRLMGADDYKISVPSNQALFGFGDAVCVPVIDWIAQYYLNPAINDLLRGNPLYLSDASGQQ